MNPVPPVDLSQYSMLDMFRLEAETQTARLAEGLLELEANSSPAASLEELMRAAHSLKGAARMVNLDVAVRLSHAMEDRFVAAQQEGACPPRHQIDALLLGVDLIKQLVLVPEGQLAAWVQQVKPQMEQFYADIAAPTEAGQQAPPLSIPTAPEELVEDARDTVGRVVTPVQPEGIRAETGRQAVRVTADNLSRLLGLAGETRVASRWLDSYTADLLRLKRLQRTWSSAVHRLEERLTGIVQDEQITAQLLEIRTRETACMALMSSCLDEMESFDRRFLSLAKQLHQEVLDCRMRPFADCTLGFSRMVRDISRSLGKEIKLEVTGGSTPVDRDILDQLEGPLVHLLRNAIDHGIEVPDQRINAGKLAGGTIEVRAKHRAGMLLISVLDDGRGIDPETIRQAVLQDRLAGVEVAEKLSDAELLEFLFLPGFTLTKAVTDISGRGVGLNAVQAMVKRVGGTVRVLSRPGLSTEFQLQLPLTLSVLRTLLVEIAGEPYALPLNRMVSAVKVTRDEVFSAEGRQHFSMLGRQIGLVTAHQLLESKGHFPMDAELSVVVLGDATHQYGLVVDRFLGERELIVRTLDPRLGKVQDVSAAAQMADQTPVLIFDVDDLLRSIENLVSGQRLTRIATGGALVEETRVKRVLVVDDSLTVRELERKLIASSGYQVEVAVDGLDGWNAVRTGHFDLVVTDVDMPRMDGIELVTLMKRDPRLQAIPIMIVSYKDRPADKQRGLEAGADYYLTKGSFQDETLLEAVSDLIGSAEL